MYNFFGPRCTINTKTNHALRSFCRSVSAAVHTALFDESRDIDLGLETVRSSLFPVSSFDRRHSVVKSLPAAVSRRMTEARAAWPPSETWSSSSGSSSLRYFRHPESLLSIDSLSSCGHLVGQVFLFADDVAAVLSNIPNRVALELISSTQSIFKIKLFLLTVTFLVELTAFLSFQCLNSVR